MAWGREIRTSIGLKLRDVAAEVGVFANHHRPSDSTYMLGFMQYNLPQRGLHYLRAGVDNIVGPPAKAASNRLMSVSRRLLERPRSHRHR